MKTEVIILIVVACIGVWCLYEKEKFSSRYEPCDPQCLAKQRAHLQGGQIIQIQGS